MKCTPRTFFPILLLAAAAALPARAAWTYDAGAKELSKGGVTLENVTASGTNLTIGKNQSTAVTDLDLTDGVDGGYAVTAIAGNAFQKNANLVTVALPPTLLTMGDYAFSECANLVTLDTTQATNSLTVLPKHFVSSCYKLEGKIVFGPSLVKLNGNSSFRYTGYQGGGLEVTFDGCSLTNQTFGNEHFQYSGITKLDFENCKSLGSFTGYGINFDSTHPPKLAEIRFPATTFTFPNNSIRGYKTANNPVPLDIWFLKLPTLGETFVNDSAGGDITIHIPYAESTSGTVGWNDMAGEWTTYLAKQQSKYTAPSDVSFADDGTFTGTAGTWTLSGAVLKVVYRRDPVQQEVGSKPQYTGTFDGRGYTTADFTGRVTSFDDVHAESVDLTITLYSDEALTSVADSLKQTISVIATDVPFSFTGLKENTTYWAVMTGVDSEGNEGGAFPLGSFTTKWEDTAWTYYPEKGTLEKGWIVVKKVTADGTSLSIDASSNNGDTEIPDLDFTGGIRDGYSLVSVGYEAFRGCTALTNAVLPDTVTNIGGNAFYECPALAAFVAEGPVAIGGSAFNANNKTSSLRTVRIPNVVEIGGAAFLANTLLETLGSELRSLRSVGKEAFASCTSLEGDFVLTNLVSTGEWTFNKATKVTSLVFGTGVTNVQQRAFGGMAGLTNLVFQGAVESFANDAFLGNGPGSGVSETLHLYLTSVPSSFGARVFGQQFNGGTTGVADDAARIVVHVPWYRNVDKGRSAADGTTSTFAEWARAWQNATTESLTEAGCTTTKFELPTTRNGLGVWRNDGDWNSGFVMRLAYYSDPDKTDVGTMLILF